MFIFSGGYLGFYAAPAALTAQQLTAAGTNARLSIQTFLTKETSFAGLTAAAGLPQAYAGAPAAAQAAPTVAVAPQQTQPSADARTQ